jgi:hypothetical protein
MSDEPKKTQAIPPWLVVSLIVALLAFIVLGVMSLLNGQPIIHLGTFGPD